MVELNLTVGQRLLLEFKAWYISLVRYILVMQNILYTGRPSQIMCATVLFCIWI